MTLDAIKEAISELPESEKHVLVNWLNAQEVAAWDKQLEADFSAGGSGLILLEAWDAEIKSGESAPLEEFLAHREMAKRNE